MDFRASQYSQRYAYNFNDWNADLKEPEDLSERVRLYLDYCREEDKKADFTRASLAGIDLTGVDLEGAELMDVDLTGANLTGANMKGCGLTDADLTGADLTGTIFVDANLFGTDLTNTKLIHSDLTRSSLTSTHLTGADLTGAILREVGFRNVKLTGTILSGVDFTDAMFEKIDFSDIKLTAINFTGASFTKCEFISTDLTGANLTKCKFIGTNNLTGASLKGADLTDADFTGAILAYTDLTDNILMDIDSTDNGLNDEELSVGDNHMEVLEDDGEIVSRWSKKTKLKNTNFSGALFDGADVRGVDFSESLHFTIAQLESAIYDVTNTIISQEQYESDRCPCAVSYDPFKAMLLKEPVTDSLKVVKISQPTEEDVHQEREGVRRAAVRAAGRNGRE